MIHKAAVDPVIEEIHKVRREISDRFGGDVRAISADANARMAASGCPVWIPKGNKARPPSGETELPEEENASSPPDDR